MEKIHTIIGSFAIAAVFLASFALPALANDNATSACADTATIALGEGWTDCRDATEETLSEVRSFLSASASGDTTTNDEELIEELDSLTQAIQDLLQSLTALY